jgi:hypothetical protein
VGNIEEKEEPRRVNFPRVPLLPPHLFLLIPENKNKLSLESVWERWNVFSAVYLRKFCLKIKK